MGDLVHAFGIDWKLLIAQGVNFIILLVVLSYFLYGPLMRTLKERRELIAKGIADAEAASAERSQVATEKAGVLAEAHHQGSLIVARAEEEGKAERAEILRTAQARAESLLKDAAAEAEEAKRRALKESETEIARAAVLAAEKILRTNQ